MDPDFAAEILEDFYVYRRKRRWVAWLLWATLGIVGGHRFYLDRPGTGLLMLFTGGGGMIWWMVDAFLLPSMVRGQIREQERREEEGLPPLELRFMPPLHREALSRPPEWTAEWQEAGRARRRARFIGDIFVLLLSASCLAALAKLEGVWEAMVGVLVLAVVASLGGSVGWWARVPVLRSLLRWSHRLRLFYYFNRPGSPAALLLRSVTATITAPFRARERAEVRLYAQLGAFFTVLFVLVEFGEEVVGLLTGAGMPAIGALLQGWLGDAGMTFVAIYAFAAPIGAVITFYLLVTPTHSLPRRLSGLVVATMLLTALVV